MTFIPILANRLDCKTIISIDDVSGGADDVFPLYFDIVSDLRN